MMEDLMKRGDDLAAEGQQQKLQDVASQLRAMFGNAAVEISDGQVAVTSKGIVKRWLTDPSLRFLAGALR